ncbi:MAG TPA: transposase [Streptosporangiaceae bacterium]|nr:transposase [Streptosporangiaceae bacterium]
MAVMIGIDPHKGSHTAVVIGPSGEPLGRQRVRACPGQAQQLLAWAAAWPERTWAAGGATGLGRMLAQQLAAAGEQVLDIQPRLAARVRLPGAGDVNNNDPNDARSVAVAALRSRAQRQVAADGHAAVLKIWAKRHRDLARSRNQVARRLHAVLCELVPGGFAGEITAGLAARVLDQVSPAGAAAAARHDLATEFLADLRRLDAQRRECAKKLAAAARACGTSLTGLFGAGPVIAGLVIGDVPDVTRFPSRSHFAACNGTAPAGVSSGGRKIHRLSPRGNRRQPRDPHGRDHPDPAPAQRRPRLLRAQDRPGKDPQGSAALPETADQRRDLRAAARRRPPSRRSGLEGPDRATGEPLCLQGGRLPPRTPALRTSHSRAADQPTRHGSAHTGHPARAAGKQNPANHLTTATTKRIRSGRQSPASAQPWCRDRIRCSAHRRAGARD